LVSESNFLKQTALHSVSLILQATLALFLMNILPSPVRSNHFLGPDILISVTCCICHYLDSKTAKTAVSSLPLLSTPNMTIVL